MPWRHRMMTALCRPCPSPPWGDLERSRVSAAKNRATTLTGGGLSGGLRQEFSEGRGWSGPLARARQRGDGKGPALLGGDIWGQMKNPGRAGGSFSSDPNNSKNDKSLLPAKVLKKSLLIMPPTVPDPRIPRKLLGHLLLVPVSRSASNIGAPYLQIYLRILSRFEHPTLCDGPRRGTMWHQT